MISRARVAYEQSSFSSIDDLVNFQDRIEKLASRVLKCANIRVFIVSLDDLIDLRLALHKSKIFVRRSSTPSLLESPPAIITEPFLEPASSVKVPKVQNVPEMISAPVQITFEEQLPQPSPPSKKIIHASLRHECAALSHKGVWPPLSLIPRVPSEECSHHNRGNLLGICDRCLGHVRTIEPKYPNIRSLVKSRQQYLLSLEKRGFARFYDWLENKEPYVHDVIVPKVARQPQRDFSLRVIGNYSERPTQMSARTFRSFTRASNNIANPRIKHAVNEFSKSVQQGGDLSTTLTDVWEAVKSGLGRMSGSKIASFVVFPVLIAVGAAILLWTPTSTVGMVVKIVTSSIAIGLAAGALTTVVHELIDFFNDVVSCFSKIRTARELRSGPPVDSEDELVIPRNDTDRVLQQTKINFEAYATRDPSSSNAFKNRDHQGSITSIELPVPESLLQSADVEDEEQSWLNDLITSSVDRLGRILDTTVKKADVAFAKLSVVAKTIRDFKTVSEIIVPLGETIISFFYEKVYDEIWVPPRHRVAMEKVAPFIARVEELDAMHDLESQASSDSDLCKRIQDLIKEAAELELSLMKASVETRFLTPFTIANAKVGIFKTMLKSADKTADDRAMTVWAYIFGPSNAGKTHFLRWLYPQVWSAYNKIKHVDNAKPFDSSMVFSLKSINEFWDGYRSQAFTEYDDFLQDKDPAKRATAATNAIYMANTAPFQLNMSAIVDKAGTYYSSKWFFTSSNDIACPEGLGLTSYAAFDRRRFMVIKLTARPERKNLKVDHPDYAKGWVIDIHDGGGHLVASDVEPSRVIGMLASQAVDNEIKNTIKPTLVPFEVPQEGDEIVNSLNTVRPRLAVAMQEEKVRERAKYYRQQGAKQSRVDPMIREAITVFYDSSGSKQQWDKDTHHMICKLLERDFPLPKFSSLALSSVYHRMSARAYELEIEKYSEEPTASAFKELLEKARRFPSNLIDSLLQKAWLGAFKRAKETMITWIGTHQIALCLTAVSVLAIISGGIIFAIWNHFRPNDHVVLQKDPSNKDEDAKRKDAKNKKKYEDAETRRLARLEAQKEAAEEALKRRHQISNSSGETFKEYFMRSLQRVKVVQENDVYSGQLLFIGAHCAITAKHVAESFATGVSAESYYMVGDKTVTFNFKPKEVLIANIPKTEAAMIKFPESAFPPRTHLWKKFPKESWLNEPNRSISEVCLTYRMVNGAHDTLKAPRADLVVSSGDFYWESEGVDSPNGSSGGLLWSENTSFVGPLGLHSARSTHYAWASVLSCELLEAVGGDWLAVPEPISEKHDFVSLDTAPLANNMESLGIIKQGTSLPRRVKITQSPIADALLSRGYTSTSVPVSVRPFEPQTVALSIAARGFMTEEEAYTYPLATVSPLDNSLAKLDVNPPAISEKVLAFANSLDRTISRHYSQPYIILNLEDAVFGNASIGVESMDLKASPGYPWTIKGFSQKRQLVGNPEPGERTTRDTWHPAFLASVENALKAVVSGAVYRPTFSDTLKIERRDIERVLLGKTRRYYASSFQHLIVSKIFCWSYVNPFQYACTGTVCVGIDPHSSQWGELWRRLNKNPNMIETDASNWDVSLPYPLIHCTATRCSKDVRRIIGRAGLDVRETTCRGMTVEQIQIAFVNCVVSGSNADHVQENKMMSWYHSWASGTWGTAQFNCFFNDTATCCSYALASIDAKVSIGVPAISYKENVESAFYGDDALLAVTNFAARFFTPKSYTYWMRVLFRIVLTDPEGNPPSDFFVAPDTAKFLKRKFLKAVGHVWAPLPKEVIIDSLFWVTDPKFASSICTDTVRSALMESVHHGRSFYEELYKVLEDVCLACRVKFDPIAFEVVVGMITKS